MATHTGEACRPEALAPIAGDHEQSTVFRIAGPPAAVVKVHRHRPNAGREALVLRRWRAAGLAGWLPKVLAVDEERGWLLLSTLGGTPGREVVGTKQEPGMFEAAGRFRSALDAIALRVEERDDMPARVAWARRFDGALARASGRVSEEQVEDWRARFDPSVFAGVVRRWCHRDFAPHNWLWDGECRRLGVLDLGQARVDVPEVDVLKMDIDGAWGMEGLRADFLRGWGRDWGAPQTRRLAMVRLVWEVGSVGRAT